MAIICYQCSDTFTDCMCSQAAPSRRECFSGGGQHLHRLLPLFIYLRDFFISFHALSSPNHSMQATPVCAALGCIRSGVPDLRVSCTLVADWHGCHYDTPTVFVCGRLVCHGLLAHLLRVAVQAAPSAARLPQSGFVLNLRPFMPCDISGGRFAAHFDGRCAANNPSAPNRRWRLGSVGNAGLAFRFHVGGR